MMLRIAFFTLATALQAISAMEVTAQEPRPGALEPREPKYGVRLEPSVMIAMRDGVRLSTDLYYPEGAPGKLPVVLIRSPYNKKRYELASQVLVAPRLFTGQGYVVAVQDTRGKWESEGTYTLNRGYPSPLRSRSSPQLYRVHLEMRLARATRTAHPAHRLPVETTSPARTSTLPRRRCAKKMISRRGTRRRPSYRSSSTPWGSPVAPRASAPS